MQTGNATSPLPLIIVLIVVGWLVYRRTRPQQVRLTRTMVLTALIVVLSIFGLTANRDVFGQPLFLALAPLAVLAGLLLGWVMMGTMRFWRDESTGNVWMSGGVAYVAIWLATLVLRLGVEYVGTGTFGPARTSESAAPTTASIVASDLLLLSTGLWLARGYALVRWYRKLAAASSG